MPSYQTKHELFKFPMKGVHVTGMKNEQPDGTCIDAVNVRAYDAIEDRARGGSRPGLSRYIATTINANNRIQDLNYVTSISTSLSNTSMSRRTITAVAVSDGVIAKFTSSSVTNATVSGTQALGNTAQSPFAFSAELFQRLYYADGYGYKVYVGSNNAAIDWTPTAGSLPGDQANNVTCRLIEAWRGRIVLSGLPSDPYNWFMSKLGDPLNFQYFAVPETELDAVQGGNGFIGKVPDVINAIIPYSDDVLIFGCDHSIWMMSGDPQAGGRLDLVTNTVGMAFGRPYTQMPDGTLFFFSSRGSVYQMPPGGGKPRSITEKSIDPLITNTNLNTNIVRMAYDEKAEGVHLYITPLANSATTHWFYDIRNEGWFKVTFGSTGLNPIALMVFDGDDPGDRQIILGSETSHVNVYDESAFTDAGTSFDSYAIMGPIVEDEGRTPTVLTDLQLVMDDTSANTKFEIGEGDTAESAIANFSANFDGERHAGDNTAYVVSAGKSVNFNPRTRGYFQYFKVGTTAATGPWAIEYIQAKYRVVKSSRGRGFLTESISYVAPGDPPFLNSSGLIFAFWADKNVTVNSVNSSLLDSWSLYQQGDTGNTKPIFQSGATKARYLSADPLMQNNKASVNTFGSGISSNAALMGMDHDNGWLIWAGYYKREDAGDFFNVDPWPGGSDFSFITGHGTNTSFFGMQMNDNGGAGGNTQPLTPANDWAINTFGIYAMGRTPFGGADPQGWKWRVNGTNTRSVNLGRWWDDIDTGGGVALALGTGSQMYISMFAVYAGANTTLAQVRAIEETIADYYSFTLS